MSLKEIWSFRFSLGFRFWFWILMSSQEIDNSFRFRSSSNCYFWEISIFGGPELSLILFLCRIHFIDGSLLTCKSLNSFLYEIISSININFIISFLNLNNLFLKYFLLFFLLLEFIDVCELFNFLVYRS